MKNSRHYLILISLILLIVSVFLSSCGIPTFCNLDGIVIKDINKTSNTEFSFKINGTSEDLQDVITKGPGFLIMYVLDDEMLDSNEIYTYKNQFSEKAKTRISINKKVISLESKSLGVFNNFSNNGTEVHDAAQSWKYNLDLSDFNTTNKSFDNVEFIMKLVTADEYKILVDLYNNDVFIKGLSIENPDINMNYLHIFAAFSGEVGNFSNTYWSNLYYLGTLNLK